LRQQAGKGPGEDRNGKIEGKVDMDVNYALEDYEIARGFVLSCQSFPATDRVVIDFDQAE